MARGYLSKLTPGQRRAFGAVTLAALALTLFGLSREFVAQEHAAVAFDVDMQVQRSMHMKRRVSILLIGLLGMFTAAAQMPQGHPAMPQRPAPEDAGPQGEEKLRWICAQLRLNADQKQQAESLIAVYHAELKESEENKDALHCINGYNLCMNGNNLDDHLRHGVVIENTYGSVVSGNMIEECRGTAIVLDRDCYGITLAANVIAHDSAGGIDLRDAHGCAVSANTFTIMKAIRPRL